MNATLIVACVTACSLASSAGAKDRPPPRQDEPRQATGCEYLGKGYSKAAGSDTCVKISGSTRVEGAVFQR